MRGMGIERDVEIHILLICYGDRWKGTVNELCSSKK